MIGPMTCPTCNAALPEYDELRAEVERLGGFVAEMQPELGKLKTENERLRAEVVRLDDLADDRLMEVERLRAAIRLALQYMTSGTREYMATREDGQATVDTLLDALDRPKE